MNYQLQTKHESVTSVLHFDGISIGKIIAFPGQLKDRFTEVGPKNFNRRIVLGEGDDSINDLLRTNHPWWGGALRYFELADSLRRLPSVHHHQVNARCDEKGCKATHRTPPAQSYPQLWLTLRLSGVASVNGASELNEDVFGHLRSVPDEEGHVHSNRGLCGAHKF